MFFMTIHIFFLFEVYPGTPRTISLSGEIRQRCGITSNVALSIYSYCCQHNIHKVFWAANSHVLHQGN